jgi:hypothetical protein
VPYQRKLYVTRSGVDQNVRTSAEADDSHCPFVLINPRPPAKIEPPPLPSLKCGASSASRLTWRSPIAPGQGGTLRPTGGRTRDCPLDAV